MSALEVVSFLGKLLCAVAALKAALYLLRRVCLAMAWKSGGASHSELIHNLRSESAGRPPPSSRRAPAVGDRWHFPRRSAPEGGRGCCRAAPPAAVTPGSPRGERGRRGSARPAPIQAGPALSKPALRRGDLLVIYVVILFTCIFIYLSI